MATTLLDVNVLVALIWAQHVHHAAAHQHFGGLNGGFATTPITENGLVRLLLTPAVTGRNVSAHEALGALAAIRNQPGWQFLPDNSTLAIPHVDTTVLIGRRQVTDLHLVSLCAANRLQLATFDASLPRSLAPTDRTHVTLWASTP